VTLIIYIQIVNQVYNYPNLFYFNWIDSNSVFRIINMLEHVIAFLRFFALFMDYLQERPAVIRIFCFPNEPPWVHILIKGKNEDANSWWITPYIKDRHTIFLQIDYRCIVPIDEYTYNIIQEISLHTVITHYKTTASAREYSTTNGNKTSSRSMCATSVCVAYTINAAVAVPCWRTRAKSIS